MTKGTIVLVLTNNDVGLYKFRKELLQSLIDNEYRVFLSLPEGEYVPLLEEAGCTFCRTLVDRRGINPFKDMRLLLQYDGFIKKIKPDVVLTYTIKPNIYGGIICRFRHVKYIANITGLGTAIENKSILSEFLLFLYKAGLKGASQVFFQNENNQTFFLRKGLTKKSRLIPGSGVNLEEHCYEEYPKESDEIRILYVGRIMKDKGVGELLVGAEKLKKKHPNLRFALAGGYDDDEFRSEIERLEKRGILKFLGQQKDIHSIIKEHHAVIMPSYHEGLSNVLLEAAACGRPVLATDVPGCREAFDEGVSGLGFEPRDVDSFVNTIEKFIKIPYEQKAEMGKAGRKKMEREFDRDIIVEKYMQEIGRLQGKK